MWKVNAFENTLGGKIKYKLVGSYRIEFLFLLLIVNVLGVLQGRRSDEMDGWRGNEMEVK